LKKWGTNRRREKVKTNPEKDNDKTQKIRLGGFLQFQFVRKKHQTLHKEAHGDTNGKKGVGKGEGF